MQAGYWAGVVALALLAVGAGLAEHRRRGRKDMDQVGFVPWPLVQILALIGALMCAFAALH